MMPPTIGDYYRSAVGHARKEIESTPDDRVLGMDTDEWIAYLTRKWGMFEIVIDESREVRMSETEREYRLRSYDIHTGRAPGTFVRETAIRIEVPVLSSDTLQVIWENRLAPNSFSISHPYPPFEYDHNRGVFGDVVQPEPSAVQHGIERIKATVHSYNESIQSEDPQFLSQIVQLVNAQRDLVQSKHKSLDALAAAVGVPLTKKADISKIVPAAPRVRAAVAPVVPPMSKLRTRPVLEPAKFASILELLDNSGRQFERTPQSFQQLTEEGLRDIILGSLNAVFEGAAGGETFQGIGKVDIHLRISQGEIFIAELKFWDGPESLREVLKQLRGRLTWRDSYGVAVVLSRNSGFTGVLTAVKNALPTAEGYVAGTLQNRAANQFVARFTIPSDDVRQASIHVLVYNLYVGRPGRRMVRHEKKSGT